MRRTHSLFRPLVAGTAILAPVVGGVIITACAPHMVPESGPRMVSAEPISIPQTPDEMHAKVFADNGYPTAAQCGECHPKHFDEWSVSPHAYAQISPVFNAMQGTVTKLTNGANADFCIRCHAPVGMALGEPVFTENKNRAQASLEGITCIVCHRVSEDEGKVSGRFKLRKGDIHAPVYGPGDGEEFRRILEQNDEQDGHFHGSLKTTADADGEFPIHGELKQSFFISQPSLCGTCHDVTSPGGFRLEEAFSEYKSSPAARNGVSCQDCHMSTHEGVDVDHFEVQPAAILPDGRTTQPRRLSSHYFAGPDYSIVHPGIYPVMRGTQAELATLTEWQNFDLSWGSPEFEADVPDDVDFKYEVWESARNRKKAHEILYGPNGQIAKLEIYRRRQLDVMRAGYQLGEVEVKRTGPDGIKFSVQARNGTDGHNVPTGFIAERSLFIQTTVTDRDGEVVFQSGDLDPNGDVRDLHSVYVHNGALELDKFLFSLQSKFIIRLFRGGEREQVLAVNLSADPLPFTRPSPTPTIATGRPVGARTQRVGLPPNGTRWANYTVRKDQLTGNGPYTAKVRMVAGMVPINLVHEIRHVGFDYGMNPRQIGDRIVAGRQLLWEGEFSLDVKGPVDVDWSQPEPAPIDWWHVPDSHADAGAASAADRHANGAADDARAALASIHGWNDDRESGQ